MPAKTVDEYISKYPSEIQELLNQMRNTIREAAPGANESISYGMPAYKLNKKLLVYFAAFKNHIGFYATPSGHSKFSKELAKYKQGKGSVQFPISEPLPIELIKQITLFRVDENMRK